MFLSACVAPKQGDDCGWKNDSFLEKKKPWKTRFFYRFFSVSLNSSLFHRAMPTGTDHGWKHHLKHSGNSIRSNINSASRPTKMACKKCLTFFSLGKMSLSQRTSLYHSSGSPEEGLPMNRGEFVSARARSAWGHGLTFGYCGRQK